MHTNNLEIRRQICLYNFPIYMTTKLVKQKSTTSLNLFLTKIYAKKIKNPKCNTKQSIQKTI